MKNYWRPLKKYISYMESIVAVMRNYCNLLCCYAVIMKTE